MKTKLGAIILLSFLFQINAYNQDVSKERYRTVDLIEPRIKQELEDITQNLNCLDTSKMQPNNILKLSIYLKDYNIRKDSGTISFEFVIQDKFIRYDYNCINYGIIELNNINIFIDLDSPVVFYNYSDKFITYYIKRIYYKDFLKGSDSEDYIYPSLRSHAWVYDLIGGALIPVGGNMECD